MIGKRFQDAGLRDLCVESGVLAEGSVAGLMAGHKYNRAIRVHKLVYEALMRLVWKGFITWLEEHHAEEVPNLEESINNIDIFHSNVSQGSLQDLLQQQSCRRILQLFQDYLNSFKDQHSLSAFWMSYIDIVEIMREGDWMLHLASIRDTIPWCFAYDKLNYARFLNYYYASMSGLPIEHPEIHNHFMQGGFSVQICSHNPFGRIPVDQTIEETINKDTQTPGGTKGFSLKPVAVAPYYMTSEYRSTFLRQSRSMVHVDQHDYFSHPDIRFPRIRKDEADIQSLIQLMDSSWLNPFNPDQDELVSISTATVTPAEVAKDLLESHKIGEEAYQAFKKKNV